MIRILLLTLMLIGTALAQLPNDVLQQLTSSDVSSRQPAWDTLQKAVVEAAHPGAEAERRALCLQLCAELDRRPPDHAALLLLECLRQIGDEESVETLVRQLNASDQHLRAEAIRALAQNTSPAAAEALLLQLKQGRRRTERETVGLIDALSDRRPEGSVRLLAGYLNKSDDTVFIATVKTLATAEDIDGMRALAAQLGRVKGHRRALLLSALMSTGEDSALEHFYATEKDERIRALAFLGLLVKGRVELVNDLMQTDDPLMWAALFEAAVQTKHPRLFEWISENLSKLPPMLQLAGLSALETSGDPLYAFAVEPLLNSETDYLSHEAAVALGLVGRAESVPLLLASDLPESKRALSRINAPGVGDVLESMAVDGEDIKERTRAIQALALRGRKDLMRVYINCALTDSGPLSEAGVAAVGQLGGMEQLDPLTRLLLDKASSPLSRDIQKAMVDILRRVEQPEEAVLVLTSHMNGASLRAQALILQILAQLGSAEALKPVVDACQSSDTALRKQAVKLLSGWKDRAAVPEMLSLAGKGDTTLAEHVQFMRGISRLLAEEKTVNEDQLLQALSICRRADEKLIFIPMLEKCKTPEARDVLEQYREDPEFRQAFSE